MVRFFRLIHNEYIKVFHKVSTYIMLGLVVIAALGLNLVSIMIQNVSNNNSYYQQSYDVSYYDNEIDYLKTAKPDGYELSIERLTFMKEQEISYNGMNDWRSATVYEMYDQKARAENLLDFEGSEQEIKRINTFFDEAKAAVIAKEWKDLCNAQIKFIDADQAMDQDQKNEAKWAYQYRLDHNVPMDANDWKSNLLDETAALKPKVEQAKKAQQSGAGGEVADLEKQENQLKINLYRLENNVAVDVGTSGLMKDQDFGFWTVFTSSPSLIQFVSVLILVIAGSCVASEFSSGTIKFLLINPVKRGKILASKYVMVLSFSYIMLALFFVVNILFTMLFFGTGNLGAPYLYISGGSVHALSGFLYMAWMYLLGSVNMIVMATLAFAISSLIRSSALAIGVSLFAMLAGSGAVLFMKEMFHLDWTRYIIFANTDLNAIVTGTTPFANQTVGFALTVIAVYMVVFLLTAWDGFVRREV